MTRSNYHNSDRKADRDMANKNKLRPPQNQVQNRNQKGEPFRRDDRRPPPNYANNRFGDLFMKKPRNYRCLLYPGQIFLPIIKLDGDNIKNYLARECATIEHQFIMLRTKTQLTERDFNQRYQFTELFLSCLAKHHGVFYEGILFGSTVNGLGFKDSDVDLRLRRLMPVGEDLYEPLPLDTDMVERTLRDIAFQTRRCCPAKGEFVPSVRCPVAKLKLQYFGKGSNDKFLEGLNFDISLAAQNSLGSFNSMFLKFLCDLQPKFHLLATVLRYWSKCQELIQPGDLSSYALVNMLIFFCQTIQPPLLPTVNEMRQIYLEQQDKLGTDKKPSNQALTQLEWHGLVCFNKDLYPVSRNNDILSVLLLKFFEFYLTFPFKSHIITIRPGRALEHAEFALSSQYHPRFPIKSFVNIQDPFDLKHNLTSGLEGQHFNLLMITIRHSYERLYNELMNNFYQPRCDLNCFLENAGSQSSSSSTELGNQDGNHVNNSQESKDQLQNKSATKIKVLKKQDKRDWGLNVLFNKLNKQELNDS